jgi:hypothetical protein
LAGGVVNACGRLWRQLDFVAGRTFGTREQAAQRIRRAHARLIRLDSAPALAWAGRMWSSGERFATDVAA